MNYSEEEDHKLLEELIQGDKMAFNELVQRHQKKVYNLAFRLCSDREAAEDIAQESFLRVYRKATSFSGNSKFSTWLYQITVNVAYDAGRKAKRSKNILSMDTEFQTKDGEYKRQFSNDELTPDEWLLRKERQLMVRKAIDCLPEHHKCVIVLRDLEEKTYDEIVTITQTSLGTIKSRLHRARLELRKILSKVMEHNK